jgi:hypothetical protein
MGVRQAEMTIHPAVNTGSGFISRLQGKGIQMRKQISLAVVFCAVFTALASDSSTKEIGARIRGTVTDASGSECRTQKSKPPIRWQFSVP